MISTNKTFERIKFFFGKSDSDELILLKGHLLIEEILDLIIRETIGESNFKQLGLNFYRKMILVCGLTNCSDDSDLMKQIKEVNRIRNQFAHNLNGSIRTDLIGIIKSVHGGNLPKTINRKTTYLNSLKRSFYFLLGQLFGHYKAYKIIKLKSKTA